jgi:phosphatidylglycerol:prolipoprotein diacylglycerol transferase
LTGGIFGAKLTRLLFATTSGANIGALAAHPDGKTIIGGILFGWLAVELAKRKFGIKRSTGDCFAFALPLGEAVGRVGCFLNGCCYGSQCTLPWAVYQHGDWRHPAQIYSVIVCLSIFATLWCLRLKCDRQGDLFRLYLLLWSVSRFSLEFVRERTDVHFGLSTAQWVCGEISATVLIAIVVMPMLAEKREPSEGVYEH